MATDLSREMIAQIVAWWKEGASTTEIGVGLQQWWPNYPGSLSTSAISGLIHRLRLSGHDLPERHKFTKKYPIVEGRPRRPKIIRRIALPSQPEYERP